MGKRGIGEASEGNYFSGFASLVLGLRGWGGVFNIRRRTSFGFRFGSSSLRGSLSVAIGKPSGNQIIQEKTQLLLKKANDVFYNNLGDYEYGMPYADEIILTAILNEMVKLGLTNLQCLEKVLQFLPKNQRCLER